MRLGYNSSGFAPDALHDTLPRLAEIGYQSVAVMLERDHLDPPDRGAAAACASRIKPLIDATGLSITIETGSRFILDPTRKHQPTLISSTASGRRRRMEFLKAAIDVAAALSADSVSLWSGAADDDAGVSELWDRLVRGTVEVLDHAGSQGVPLSFEPEPGMFIDTMDGFRKLHQAVNHPLLGLTLDVGHVHCLNDGDVGAHIHRWRDRLWNIHIEDMKRGVHEHLMFGDGDMDFVPIFKALREIDYRGPLHVELPGHSQMSVSAAGRSYAFLRRFFQDPHGLDAGPKHILSPS